MVSSKLEHCILLLSHSVVLRSIGACIFHLNLLLECYNLHMLGILSCTIAPQELDFMTIYFCSVKELRQTYTNLILGLDEITEAYPRCVIDQLNSVSRPSNGHSKRSGCIQKDSFTQFMCSNKGLLLHCLPLGL